MPLARPVPSLGLDQQLVSKKPVATNDEVESILKGLQLDRKFFISRLDEGQTKDLQQAGDPAGETEDSGKDACPTKRRMTRMKTKAMKKTTNRQVNKRVTDFDIYLGESLMPVLAQALDSLCRQVNRMKMQGDSLDPKVRARFNPLTWLAQQLLRRHPKCAKTPRRQAIYANFRNWSDLERGRREMLRRRDVVRDVFDGFVLRNVVQRADLPHVVDAIDDTLRLDGVLKDNKALRHALELERQSTPDTVNRKDSGLDSANNRKQTRRDRDTFFKDGGWTFEQFWNRYAEVIMKTDVVPFSVIQRGIALKQQHALLLSEAEAARKKEEEERRQQDADQRRRNNEYKEVYNEMKENEHIQAILSSDKVLTGDDVRPGDAGYEFEVPPNGAHVTMLWKFLILLGFESLDKTKEKPQTPSPNTLPESAPQLSAVPTPYCSETWSAGERWWDDELASAWSTLQEMFHCEISDGVVEKDALAKVLVPPVGFLMHRNKISEELELREDRDPLTMGQESRRASDADKEKFQSNAGVAGKKPSIETLCHRLAITMSRMEWLHRLFESYLQPDENTPDQIPVCGYPQEPAAIKKVQMRALMKEIRPHMEEVEFEMRFRRIDTDLSNMVEFDEFVTWVREDEVRVAGAAPLQKMTFEELAVVYGESVELVKYLHDRFQDCFPAEDRDNYPTNPKSLSKVEVRELVTSLAPDMPDADFELYFQMTTFSKKDTLEFDEFLEVIALDELPDEIRDAADPGPGSP